MSALFQITRIRSKTDTLTSILMGQDVQLKLFLPPCLATAKEEDQAAYLAERILFWIAHSNRDIWPETLRRIRAWLYESILYLLFHCPEDDHTFHGILKIMYLPLEVRTSICSESKHQVCFHHVAKDLRPPIDEEDLELVFYKMADQMCDLAKRYEQVLALMESLKKK